VPSARSNGSSAVSRFLSRCSTARRAERGPEPGQPRQRLGQRLDLGDAMRGDSGRNRKETAPSLGEAGGLSREVRGGGTSSTAFAGMTIVAMGAMRIVFMGTPDFAVPRSRRWSRQGTTSWRL
jgi:hypothetical protein